MKLREYFLYTLLCQCSTRVHASTTTHAWGAADVGEHPSPLVHRLYILIQISKAGQRKLKTVYEVYEDSVHLLLLVNKVQSIRVLRQNACSCVRMCMCRVTLMNARRRLTLKRRNCWSHIFFFNQSWTTDVTWIISSLSLLYLSWPWTW